MDDVSVRWKSVRGGGIMSLLHFKRGEIHTKNLNMQIVVKFYSHYYLAFYKSQKATTRPSRLLDPNLNNEET